MIRPEYGEVPTSVDDCVVAVGCSNADRICHPITSKERKGLQMSIWLYLLIIVLAVLAFGGYRRYSRR